MQAIRFPGAEIYYDEHFLAPDAPRRTFSAEHRKACLLTVPGGRDTLPPLIV